VIRAFEYYFFDAFHFNFALVPIFYMQQGMLNGQKKFDSDYIKVNLQVLFFQEEGIHYAYMPSLDLTGYGHSKKEASASLTIVFEEFLRYTLKKKTLLTELQRLGWKLKSKTKPMLAPRMSDLIKSNEQLKEIINSKNFSSSSYPVQLPAVA
jgi:hypothetical protein